MWPSNDFWLEVQASTSSPNNMSNWHISMFVAQTIHHLDSLGHLCDVDGCAHDISSYAR